MPRPSVSVVEGRRAPSGARVGRTGCGCGCVRPTADGCRVPDRRLGAAGVPDPGANPGPRPGRQRPRSVGHPDPGVRSAARRPVPSRGIVVARSSRVRCTGGTATVESCRRSSSKTTVSATSASVRRTGGAAGSSRRRSRPDTPLDDEPFPCPVSPGPPSHRSVWDSTVRAAPLSCPGERGSPVDASWRTPGRACSISSRSSASPISDVLPDAAPIATALPVSVVRADPAGVPVVGGPSAATGRATDGPSPRDRALTP